MQALGSGRQNLGVKVTRYNKQFGNKRSDVVKGCKIFHAKQTKLAFQSLDEEFHVAPEMIIITGIPTGGVHTVMSPGLREDPKIREVASILDEAVQHRMEINRKAAKDFGWKRTRISGWLGKHGGGGGGRPPEEGQRLQQAAGRGDPVSQPDIAAQSCGRPR
jgi:hypothetical protein